MSSMIEPAENWVLMTVAQNLNPRPRAIRCQAAGTFNAPGKNGVALDFTMTAGAIEPIRPVTVNSITSGTFYVLY